MAPSLASLLARASIDDHAEALEIADAAIAASKNSDPTAQHTKVVALLRLERYDDALRAIASAGTALEARCTLEKAYALYRTGALDEAAALLRDHGGVHIDDHGDGDGAERPLRHVAAQVAYRAERFDEAAALYAGLMEDVGAAAAAGETTDLVINQLATHAQLEWQGRGDLVPEGSKQPRREDMEAFETAYNAGCGCVARGDLAKASVLLKRAADLCDAAEDLSDEDKRLELLPIVLQQAYVLTLLGRTEEAAELQKSIEDDE
jgi:signal recognition particle subunit SRP72